MNDELPEDAAITELGRRVGRWRMAIISIAVVAGVATAIATYWTFRDYQISANGAHAPMLTGAGAFGVGLAVIGIGWLLSRIAIRLRRTAWVAEIAARHGVAREELDDLSDTLT